MLNIVSSNDGSGSGDDTEQIANHDHAPNHYIPQFNGSKFPDGGAGSSERQAHDERRALITKLHTMKKKIKVIFSHYMINQLYIVSFYSCK